VLQQQFVQLLPRARFGGGRRLRQLSARCSRSPRPFRWRRSRPPGCRSLGASSGGRAPAPR
ncbi:unnamed protein product, partial [Effrenium voratum]